YSIESKGSTLTIKRKQPSMAISQKESCHRISSSKKNITLDLPSKVSNTSNLTSVFPRISSPALLLCSTLQYNNKCSGELAER
ncbi:hypothetical protein NGA69_09430, partial [Streptococcus thermophilus]|uniref:hypothetical protein n=1 Tax=Streptococcus thermophilus TaxID=1308 RepID=UPI00207C1533